MFKILENWNALYTETKAQSEAIIQISKIISCSFCVSYRVSNSVLFMVYKKTLAQCTDLLLNSIFCIDPLNSLVVQKGKNDVIGSITCY